MPTPEETKRLKKNKRRKERRKLLALQRRHDTLFNTDTLYAQPFNQHKFLTPSGRKYDFNLTTTVVHLLGDLFQKHFKPIQDLLIRVSVLSMAGDNI